MRPGLRYVLLLLATALVSFPLLYVGSWTATVAGCRDPGHPGTYLAYCEHPAYGSYEHEAYVFGLEPETTRALGAAQVLFLGNSRLQMAFSTPQVDRFFAARTVPYHLLGFGYGEMDVFPRRVLDRARPQPKVVVINADPFFANAISGPGYDTGRKPWASWIDGWMKRGLGVLRPLLCRLPVLCDRPIPATLRATATGQWVWQDVLLPRDTIAGAITAEKANPWPETALPAWQDNARRFLSQLGVPRECVILTGVPTPAVGAEAIAAALAGRLGLPLVQPDVPALTVSDNSHFSAESAERWSAAFLAQAAPLIDTCLARRPIDAIQPGF